MLSEELKVFDEKQKEARLVVESIKDIASMGDLFIGLISSKQVYLSENSFNMLKNTFSEIKEYIEGRETIYLSQNIFEPQMQIIFQKTQYGLKNEPCYFLKQIISPGINLSFEDKYDEDGIVVL